ncbi:hypothetical protein PMIN06_003360 [Paraphaeosphaeria minitans]
MKVDTNIAEVERIFAHVFANKLLCAEAIQAASPFATLWIGGKIHTLEMNKRLAVLGDVVANLVLCRSWFRERGQTGHLQPRAAWNNIRQTRLSNESLAQLGRTLGLEATIVSAPNPGEKGLRVMATTFEAILGAIYEDGGEEAVARAMDRVGLT